MTVADVIADALARAGTARVFVADAPDDPVLAAMERRGVAVTRVDGAATACAMAAVWGTAMGVPGAALPGHDPAGLSRGLAYAAAARAPVIVVTHGAAPSAGPISPLAPDAPLAVARDSAAHVAAHACHLAMTEPWRPVHLDVDAAVAEAPSLPVAARSRRAPVDSPDAGSLDAAVRALQAAERPVVVVGLYCRSGGDAAWIRAFVQARPAPVLVTPRARGAVPDPHPLLIGTLGAGEAERALLDEADLVVGVGVDREEAPAWPGRMILELTPVPGSSSAERVVVVGEIAAILEELAPRLRDRRLAEWDVARLHALKTAAAAPPAQGRLRTAYDVVASARGLLPAGAIAVFEGGDAWRTPSRAWQAVAPGELLTSTHRATDGFVVAAAAAAQLAHPDRRVVCFADLPAIRRASQHLGALARPDVPVLVVAVEAETASDPPLSPAPDPAAVVAPGDFPAAFQAVAGRRHAGVVVVRTARTTPENQA